jgi:hypothetical protein
VKRHLPDVAAVIAAIRRALIARHGGEEGVAEVVRRLDAQKLSAADFRAPAPRRLPACRHLPEAIGEAVMVAEGVAAAIAAVEDGLAWQQNPNYSDEVMGQPGYMDNYAHAELIGPTGAVAGDDFLLGLFILGPHLHYPPHRHPAPELYWLLSGGSLWWREGDDWRQRPADATIWHAPMVAHATRTGDGPLLAVYAWTRDTTEPARLCGR